MENSRKEAIHSLLNFDREIPKILEYLTNFNWDTDEQIIFSKSQLELVLLKFLSNQINAIEIEDWANAIESREDIKFSPQYKDLLKETIYELANPILTHPFNKSRAHEILEKLRKSG